MTRVAVIGAAGRMGQEVCRAVSDAADLELVAAVDPEAVGTPLGQLVGPGTADLDVTGELGALVEAGAEVAVDFTVAAAARRNVPWCLEDGLHAVVGTTGLGEDDLAALERHCATSGRHCVVAPNFAIGAVLMARFAELAAPHFAGAEIVELHHDAKRDAPSGTALQTAARLASARQAAGRHELGPDPTTEMVLDGARGGAGPGGVRVHSVRLPGLIAHQEVLFGDLGQSLTIRHDAYDRRSFMAGVLLAVRAVAGRPGLTVGLDALLGLEVAPAPPPEATRERILAATYDCVARWGLAKTTVEDAAREAGLSRATVYRYFPGGRDELIDAVVGWEHARFFLRLYEEVHDAASLEEVIERGLCFAHRAVADHEVLQRMLETEPGALLPALTVSGERTRRVIADFLRPYLQRHELAPGVDVGAAADFLARMVLSYIASAGRWDLEAPEQVATLVRAELLAGIVPPAARPA